jgi:hypothetical protein
VLIGYALFVSRDEKIFGSASALLFAVVVALLGTVFYWLTAAPLERRRRADSEAEVGLLARNE